MSNPIQGIIAVIGRICLCAIFLMSVVGQYIPKFDDTAKYMETVGIPAPKPMLAGAAVFLAIGGLSVVFGFYARFGAALLAIFLVLATYFFHAFWKADPKDQQMVMIEFMKNLSMFGAMLFIVANGAGAASLDAKSAKKPPA